jgi:hypothetical protein
MRDNSIDVDEGAALVCHNEDQRVTPGYCFLETLVLTVAVHSIASMMCKENRIRTIMCFHALIHLLTFAGMFSKKL